MTRFDAKNSECRVYARRAGVLARVGHDIEVRAEDFMIEIDDASLAVDAEFRASSLHVVDAVEGRERRPGKLSPSDKRQIDRNILHDVLEADRYPTVSFRSTHVEKTSSGYRVRGKLVLHGVEREIELLAHRRGAMVHAETVLHQPDYRIAPFKAFAGALRIKPEVTVELAVPFEEPNG